MPDTIVNGAGGGGPSAKVDENNRLHTQSVTQGEAVQANLDQPKTPQP